jgi:fatty acid desaturase
MRFQTKFDRWLVSVLFLSAFISGAVVPAVFFHILGANWFPILLTIFCWTIWLLALSSTLPQYYEIREDGLFIRQG